jgi:putative RNA 2'-phosphotransferase
MKGSVKQSKFLSFVLRHKPEQIGISLEDEGWTDVEILIKQCRSHGRRLSMDDLRKIVAKDGKGRYSFNEDETKIRANQGHSIEVDMKFEPQDPPDTLYHGTGAESLDSIMDCGLSKMKRQYVHLSLDLDTATKVGARHGVASILIVNTKAMKAEGYKFYLSENQVWLTENVPPDFLTVYKNNEE